MQSLDLTSIIALINQHSISEDRASQRIQNKDSIIEFSPLNDNKSIFYVVKNLKTGKITTIDGNPISGYRKESYYKDNHILEFRTYFGNNRLQSVGQMHIDSLHENAFPLGYSAAIKYPVSITEIYDGVGKLIKTIDYDKVLKFTYIDLTKLLKSKDRKAMINSIHLTEKKNGEINWDVRYISNKEGLSYLTINAKNGKVLSEFHHVQLGE